MGRPKTYEREDVTRKAMQLFWTHGFAATSTKALAEHMGINVYSLFAEFESKQGLFEATLALYHQEVVSKVFSALDQADAGLDEVFALLDFFPARANSPGAGRGCFACNVATERASSDPVSQDYVAAHLAYMEKAIANALSNAKAQGRLRRDVSCTAQSKLLATTLLGFSVLLRAGVPPRFIADAADAARAALRALQPSGLTRRHNRR